MNDQTLPKPTGYSIYDPEAKRRTIKNVLSDLYPELPNKKYSIVYADPPWDYGGKMQFDKTSASRDQIDLKKNIFISAASFQYPTLSLIELKKLNVRSIASDDALLFLWTTGPQLHHAIDLGSAWGFDYKTIAFVWNKMVHNPGKYTLSYCELCLVFKKGRIPSPRGARNIKQLVEAPRQSHSQKPQEIASRIEAMFPTQKKIELFARLDRPQWDNWGLDMLGSRGTIKKALQKKLF